MLSDHLAGAVRFAGMGASGASADEAAQQLAAALERWAGLHGDARIEQLAVLAPPAGTAGDTCDAMALIAYVEAVLTPADAFEAVAAAVEEIHDAQVHTDEEADAAPL